MRPLISELLDAVSKLSKEYPKRSINVILSAPTGYGKTVAGPLVFRELALEDVAFAQQHIMPLRAIVRDFYVNKLLRALHVGTLPDLPEGDDVLKLIWQAFRQIDLKADSIAYQMGEFIESKYARKDPLFEARYVVTTFDSYAYNLLRVPLTEMFRSVKHYVIPRTRIHLSSAFFDEAHMLLGEEGDEKLFVVVREILKYLAAAKIPIILASATMSNNVVANLKDALKDVLIVRLSNRNYKNEGLIEVFDEEFISAITSVKWRVEAIRESEVVGRAIDYLSRGLNVLVVSDTVKGTVKRYRALKAKIEEGGLDVELVLLHAKLTRGDREAALEKLERTVKSLKRPTCLVATSVIEAGVDISFDALITDAKRVESFIQRSGRVCRNPERKDTGYVCRDGAEEAVVHVVRENSLDLIVNYIENYKERFNPRLPFDHAGFKGYEELLEKAAARPVEALSDETLARDLEALLSTIYISSHTINDILWRHEFALTRTALFEAVVLDGPITSRDAEISIGSSLTMGADDVNMLLKEGCIEGVAAIDIEFETGKQDRHVIKIANYNSDIDQFIRARRAREEKVISISKLLRWAMNNRGLPALVIKKDCYVEKEGLKPWLP
jgi:CRISPR-associated endonuclease/helicase Cas3